MSGRTRIEHTETQTRVHVRVLFFGEARETVGGEEARVELRFPATLATAFEDVMESYPQLRERFGRSLLFAINQEYAPADREVFAGDELAVFPPVSGGSSDGAQAASKDFFELTIERLDVGAVARRNVPALCGATVTLDGYVREWTKGRRTLYLIYEAYESMALSEMKRLGEQAHAQFDIEHIGIVHRTGRLDIGETSVVISVSAPHRRAAFECCEWAIKELKRSVPIWKKEFYEDGEVWAEGEAVS